MDVDRRTPRAERYVADPSQLRQRGLVPNTFHCVQLLKSHLSGAFLERMMGLEPTTFCMASRRSSQLSYIRVGGPV